MRGRQSPRGRKHDLLVAERIHTLHRTCRCDTRDRRAADMQFAVIKLENGDQRSIFIARRGLHSVRIERFIIDLAVKFTDEHMPLVDMTVRGIVIGLDSADLTNAFFPAQDLVKRENVKSAVVALFARSLRDINAVAVIFDTARMPRILTAVLILELGDALHLARFGNDVNAGSGIIGHITADEKYLFLFYVFHALLNEIIGNTGHGKFLFGILIKAEITKLFPHLDTDEEQKHDTDQNTQSHEENFKCFIHRNISFPV